MEIIHVDETDLQESRNSKNPKVRSCIEKLMNEATRIEIERLKGDPNVTAKIPAHVLDYFVSIIGTGPTGPSVLSEHTGVNSSQNVQLINANFQQRESTDKIDVVVGNNYKSLEAKIGYGIIKLFDGHERICNEIDPDNYLTHVLLYKNVENRFIAMLRRDSSLKVLKKANEKSNFEEVPNDYINFNHLQVVKKNGEVAGYREFIKQFEGCCLNVWFPFLTDKVIYKGNNIFDENETSVILESLSLNLLTEELKYHSRLLSLYSLSVELGLKNQTSDAQSVLTPISHVEIGESETSDAQSVLTPISHVEIGESETSDVQSLIPSISDEQNYVLNKTDDLSSHLSKTYIEAKQNPKGQDHKMQKKEILDFCEGLLVNMDSSIPDRPCELVKTVLESKAKQEHTPNDSGIRFMALDIKKPASNECSCKSYPNSRFYEAPENTLFNQILENPRVIWEHEVGEECIKEVYHYFDENEEWLVTVDNDNITKLYHKSSNSDYWIDKSGYMLDTRDLKVIRRNSEPLSPMDLKLYFRDSFCILPLGDVVSVSYRGEVYVLKEYGEHLSVWLFYNFQSNKAVFMVKKEEIVLQRFC
ncbi:hypothetical protein TpMuguga_04g00128 [Theileria parva strain Muguga]|uniref:Uncharacterized protein n=1 Tax=Theileria parva TaxID=5875 RepID=Q4N359_THEPA|nr:uncharacterized protein TpMuguga_04g00128 [Theileria parva strain Muguga]EAN31480.1 hypothetical protein TpMuguga_04g00128 [Theileria parva strain Muguga]|eukprot:XP_763763.1 hypothetical protein [Theileria parva strain Muguga]